MTLTRLVPFRSGLNDVTVLQNRLNSIFNEFARPQTESNSEMLATGNFVPAVDVYEDAQKVVLKLEVPGIRREDLDLKIEGRTLTVRGERKFENETNEQNYHRIERSFGSFVRSFTLPTSVNSEGVEATSADGVLSITLEKKPEAKPKQITVQVAGPVANPQTQGDAQKQVEAKVG